jgi:hypothetical protein
MNLIKFTLPLKLGIEAITKLNHGGTHDKMKTEHTKNDILVVLRLDELRCFK